MAQKRSEIDVPIYGSVDIRDAGWKIAVVDATNSPAGFNNTSESDYPHLMNEFEPILSDITVVSVHIYQNRIHEIKAMLKTYERCVSWLNEQAIDARLEILFDGFDALNGYIHILDQVEVVDDVLKVQGQQPDFIVE